MLLASSYNTKK